LSNKWIKDFLRRVTTMDKELPAVCAVRKRMAAILQAIQENSYEPSAA
jgi:hypothetical protein